MTDLKSKALSGAGWAITARLLRTFVSIATMGVLSRFLSPGEFGIMALVTFVTALAQMFADFGIRAALVQRKTITRLQQDSVYWTNVGMSFVAMAGILIFAEPIAGLLGDRGAAEPLRWIAPIFLFTAMQGTPLAVLERKMNFRPIAMTEVVSAIVGAIVAIVMVWSGFGIGALVGQQLIMPLISAILYTFLSRWTPRLQFSLDELRPLLSYGRYVTGSGIVQYFANAADRPIIGNRLTPTDLGYQSMSDNIVAAPLRIIVSMVRRVMFPIMSSIQDDGERMRRGMLGVQYGLVAMMAPICFGLWALADPVVRLVLGPGWEMVAILMGYTTLRAFLNVFTDLNAVIFSAKGHAKFQFHWSIFSLVANIVVLLLAVPYGIVALAAARLSLSLVLVPINSWFVRRLTDLPAMDRVFVSFRPILSAALMAAGVGMVDKMIASHGTMARLLIGIPLGAILYVLLECLIDRKRFLELGAMLMRRGKRPRVA